MNGNRISIYSIDSPCRLKACCRVLLMVIAFLIGNSAFAIGEQHMEKYTIVGNGYSQGLVDAHGAYVIPPTYSIERQADIYLEPIPK